ncbi:MAG: hypothetical protein C7B43_20310 [Sulfobacillus benefaciens]|uniref:Mutator family transposase n=1 Tax=Sulfobacillus benefaciens TaxID=453960 RepID=A0A2T2WLS1_9FIRM|nr:MAG: hypothetical protein C7B43_20310 [Sulfobacillus benefaciens]
MGFLHEHGKQIASTNPLERLNREIGRRADVVGLFPHQTAARRLVGAVLMEYSHDGAAFSRRNFRQTFMEKLYRAANAPERLPDGERQHD